MCAFGTCETVGTRSGERKEHAELSCCAVILRPTDIDRMCTAAFPVFDSIRSGHDFSLLHEFAEVNFHGRIEGAEVAAADGEL